VYLSRFDSRRPFCYVAAFLAILTLAVCTDAQDDGGGYVGDPGYSTYGDTGPYPTGDEPLPGLGDSGGFSGGPTPSSFSGGRATGPAISSPNIFSNPIGDFFGPDTGNQPARGNYTPYVPPSDPPSSIGPPQYNPDSGIPDWARNLGPNVSIDDSTKVQQLFQERHDLQKEISADPVGDLGKLIGDMAGTFGKAPADDVPLGEERLQQSSRIDQINQELQQIFDRNNIIASPHAVDPQPSQSSRPPAAADDGDYSVHVSDSAPGGARGIPAHSTPFDWQSGWQNRFQDSLAPADFQPLAAARAPADPGGIDFRSLRWTYLSEDSFTRPGQWSARTFACGLQAIQSAGGLKLSFPQALRLVTSSFFIFLALPDRDLWVNLHPAEPDRIIPPTLGRTDVGRIMLEADFQLKRDAGRLMRQEPFAGAERALARAVVRRHGLSAEASLRWGSTGRVEISSATSRVFARESDAGVLIEGVILDVVFEQKLFHVEAGDSHGPLEISPTEWEEFLRLTRELIRPRLIRRVNEAPEYEPLREVFSARVLSDWYKRKQSGKGALARRIDGSEIDGFRSATPWDPRQLWLQFRRDYDNGVTRGFGGVSLQQMPRFERLPAHSGDGAMLLGKALLSAKGAWHRGVFRTGRILVAKQRPSRASTLFRWAIAGGLVSWLLLMSLRSRSPALLVLLGVKERW